MAITQVVLPSPSGLTVFQDTAMGGAIDSVKASSALVLSVLIDNSLNGGAACYVKLYNQASGLVVVGTTAPDEVIYVPAGQVVEHFLFTGAAAGKTFGVALSAVCVTTGGTGGTSAPLSSVKVTINYV